ncbi:MAG: iron ABC transporter permease [Thalassobaculaceae bacterium]|nr:iron ABC transporter permease [Thalassobaculaceae bacterium]
MSGSGTASGVEISDRFLLPAMAALLVLVALMSLCIGAAPLGPTQVLSSLLGGGSEIDRIIIYELRLPRVALGILLGAVLGFSGAALQGLLRNPLADPGVIGVTAAAGFGAVVAIGFGLAAVSALMVPMAAIAGAAVATVLLFSVAARNDSLLVLILTGIGISSLATALTSLAFNLAPDPITLRDMILWLLGSLENRTTTDLAIAVPFVAVGWAVMATIGRGLDALSLGEETTRSLGINVGILRWRVVLGVSASVGAMVAVCGAVGFVGLVVPHMVRPFVGYRPGRVLVASALGGAVLITLADLVTRIPTGGERLQLGVVTALIGAPVFVWIVQRSWMASR